MENLQKFFKNKKVLVTGHTGFKGSWLCRVLLNWGAEVAGMALKPTDRPSLFDLIDIKKNIRNYFIDIRNFKKVKEVIFKEKPEIVFHLAAQSLVGDSYQDPLYTFQANTIGTANILEAIKEFGGVKAAVIITTDKVYEDLSGSHHCYKETDKLGGYDPYSSSKAAAEIVIQSYLRSFFNSKSYKKSHNTLIASARAGNVIGGGDWKKDRILPDIIRAVFEKKEDLIVRNPGFVRPFQYVLEPLHGYMLLSQKLYEGKKEFCGAWNFGPEKEDCLAVQEIVNKSFKVLKRGSFIVRRSAKKHETEFLKLDASKAKKILGWKPIFNVEKALELTLGWYEGFYNKKNVVKITDQQIKLFFKKI